ncbi:MAG: XcyI family restriction endonuclease [Dehalococcoidia bacterium]
MSSRPIVPLPASRQVAFHQLLVGARKKWLVDALREALRSVDLARLRREIIEYVPDDVQSILASAGIRDEYAFPTPALLEAQPTLVGYYRLLLGVSQKAFYRAETGMSRFKSMESTGRINENQKDQLPIFCAAMCQSISDLVRQLSPSVTQRDIDELPLLTLGAQFQGGNNVGIGKQATEDVFLSILEVVKDHITSRTNRTVTITNAAGREVIVSLGADPDVNVQERVGASFSKKVAVEIKGGTDVSNIHNRAGEAEKSHQKARSEGYLECWTIIMKKGVDETRLQSESPTTNSWFDAAEILGRDGPDWERFKNRIIEIVGIPES